MNQISLETLNDPYSFDMSKHGWIEASAGTGKTYTIERFVIRAIVEKQVPLSSILVVTYTEKATGELKDRIRKLLKSVVDESLEGADAVWLQKQKVLANQKQSNMIDFVAETLDRFDDASIFTIHGFCQSLLREYSFELGRLWNYSLVNDHSLFEMLLPDVLRTLPATEADLQNELTEVEFWKPGYRGYAPFEQNVIELAKRCIAGKVTLSIDEQSTEAMRFIRRVIEKLQQRVFEYKVDHALISYDDMIVETHKAISAIHNNFANRIGQRYRYAIVDEFQDTDKIQWDIFRRCFIESSASSGRLVLVGDPKQSIYRFRGADLRTYFHAKKTLNELADKGLAEMCQIDQNYRSTADFIEATNTMFTSSLYPWQGAIDYKTETDVEFQPVKSASKVADHKIAIINRTSVNLFVLPQSNADSARLAHSRQICSEIVRLHEAGVSFSDVCILTRSAKEANLILIQLQKYGIPATIYKQRGVFQSAEAFEILYVLEALAEPGRRSMVQKALLTKFFGFRIADLDAASDLPADHPARLRLQRWQMLAVEMRWSSLFYEMMNSDEVLQLAGEGARRWERIFTNYQQIFEILLGLALRERIDLVGLLRHLKRFIRERSDNEEETLHRQETDEKRVNVMTIHVSKGLEFSFVFLFGGLTQKQSINFYEVYNDDQPVIVPKPWWGNDKEESRKEEHKSLQLAENARLYYVALTRAVFSVYLPLYRTNRSSGPVSSFLQDAIDEARSKKPLLFQEVTDEPITENEAKQRLAKISAAQSLSNVSPATTGDLPEPVMPVDLSVRMNRLLSYSSIVRTEDRRSISGSENQAESSELMLQENEIGTDQDETDEKDPSQKEQSARKDDPYQSSARLFDSLFRGVTGGNLFHAILERLDFQDDAFRKAVPGSEANDSLKLSYSNQRLISRQLESYGYPSDADHERAATELLFRLMNTEIVDGLYLRDLQPKDRIHEMEFVFLQGLMPKITSSAERFGKSFITGFVDLVFRHNNKIYILDWKSNWLHGYQQSELEFAMQDHSYDLQYSLYAQALYGWLEQNSYTVDDHFGGIVYIFLRGVRPDSTDGIYYRPAVKKEVLSFIQQRLAE